MVSLAGVSHCGLRYRVDDGNGGGSCTLDVAAICDGIRVTCTLGPLGHSGLVDSRREWMVVVRKPAMGALALDHTVAQWNDYCDSGLLVAFRDGSTHDNRDAKA